ncbi:hypothetical protein HFO86_34670 [Rhizobium leguminosarum]|uniref:hypothetical protein n=1 Tax=Rhizobium leguminosarum TaxID=384 RepID=UPI001C98174C|nr:hypothetical protein [Rhizobium leguminosarum]MBY5475290.1 hypothetical protein [Rhizobium leguminosarum]
MQFRTALFVSSLFSAIPSLAWAETCPIQNFKNYMSYSKDMMTNLSYINQVASKEDRSKSDNADLNILDYGTFNWKDASRLTQSLETLLEIKWSQKDQESLLISNLSSEGENAYIKCLQELNANLVITPSNGASTHDEFLVDYAWRPIDPASPKTADFNILVTNAIASDVPKKINSPSAGSFKIKRLSMYKPLEMAIHVGGIPNSTISLPEFPNKKIDKLLFSATVSDSVYGGGDSHFQKLCITLDNSDQESIIVPNSAKVTLLPSHEERGTMIKEPIIYNDRQACSRIIWHLEAGDGHVTGIATMEALILRAVRVATPPTQSIKTIAATSMFDAQ